MRPQFSEFSFGYALTEALVNNCQQTVRPTFPTQRKERHVGYDLRLNHPGYPIFLQFKLCHGMKRRIVREYATLGLPLSFPFLRMPLMPRRLSPQHDLLLNLENRGEEVFYAAPRFFLDEEFADHYRNRAILTHSAFIRPSAIDVLPDDRDHHIAFDCDAGHGWLLSEPRLLKPILNGGELQEKMNVPLYDERLLLDRVHTALVHIIDIVISESSKHGELFRKDQTLRQLCLIIRHVCPDFPEVDALLDTSGPKSERDSTASTTVRHELHTILDDSDSPERSVSLLSSLAQLYCNATVFLVAKLNSD